MPSSKITFGFSPRLPGRTRSGSNASFRKSYTLEARGSMADIIANYTAFIRSLKTATPDIVENALAPVFSKSLEYAPYATGALVNSGRLTVEQVGTGQILGEIIFGNHEAWYAAMVHEMVWLNHTPPTRAKYLQSAMEEELDSFLSSLAVDYAAMMV